MKIKFKAFCNAATQGKKLFTGFTVALLFITLHFPAMICHGLTVPIKNFITGKTADPEPAIYFFENNETPWLGRDTGFCGYSLICKILEKQGYTVSRLYNNLQASLNFIDPDSSLLIIPPGKYQKFRGYEIDSLEKWVARGGALIVMGEHENAYLGSSEYHNHILSVFGLFLESDCILNDEDSAWLSIDTNFSNGKKVEFYASPSIQLADKSMKTTIFAQADGRIKDEDKKIICCGVQYKGGKVIVLGDSENIFNGDANIGVQREGNTDFFLSLADWALNSVHRRNLSRANKCLPGDRPQSSSLKPGNSMTEVKPGTIWFYTGSGIISPDRVDGASLFLGRLQSNGWEIILSDQPPLTDWEASIIFNPSEVIASDTAELLCSRKCIIVHDPWTVLDNYTNNGIFLHTLGMREQGPRPLMFIESITGVEFQPVSCLDPTVNLDFKATFPKVNLSDEILSHSTMKNGPFHVLRAGRLQIVKKTLNPWIPLISLYDTGFVSSTALGLDERVPYRSSLNRSKYDKSDVNPSNLAPGEFQEGLAIDTVAAGGANPSPPHLIAVSNSRFILAYDTELLGNQGRWTKTCTAFTDYAAGWLLGRKISEDKNQN
ncbi:MAG: hypothetical protein CVV64_08235 [Candidatus Wallbacteria bacterium HGW-Wallbacteria-1]|jgi:hypothetical protein|uniref:DUF4350 domain-containing protein n=1 Tax=Candidatus Wallbacteria bacterium HGW-Wallbacteria-1 TaxID=2013854 RepID=A0A2N1PR96_9BACT|nr:MAG: hypothetical protein CVV64_08235 [Candidatus Wallbacteria bacterium HGW-Wallbacteria-1]